MPMCLKAKKEKNMSHEQTFEPWGIQVRVSDEDTIPPGRAVVPRLNRPYSFMVHATDSRQVTGCIEN